MTVDEILSQLQCNTTGEIPYEALAQAVAQREAITPGLLHTIEDAIARLPEIASDQEYMAPIYAMYLLSQFREQRAYPLLVELFSSEKDLLDLVMGDLLTDDGSRILASVCNGDTTLIEHMVENPQIDAIVRCIALGSMLVLVAQGVTSRDEVIEYYRSLFHGKLEHDCSLVWDILIGDCCELYPEELMPEIEQAYADGLVDERLVPMEEVQEALALGKERALVALYTDSAQTFIENTIDEAGSWFWLADVKEPAMPEAREPSTPEEAGPVSPTPRPDYIWHIPSSDTPLEQPVPSVPVRTGPKIGRNEPCPCGSGKKYKKCCGR